MQTLDAHADAGCVLSPDSEIFLHVLVAMNSMGCHYGMAQWRVEADAGMGTTVQEHRVEDHSHHTSPAVPLPQSSFAPWGIWWQKRVANW